MPPALKATLTYTERSPQELQKSFAKANVEIIGMIGSDVVLDSLLGPNQDKYNKVFMRGLPLPEKHKNDTIGCLMALKVESFLVFTRNGADLSHLNGRIHDRPIRAIITSTHHSSAKVRDAIARDKPFGYDLAPSVKALIEQEGLYGYFPTTLH